MEMAPKLYYLPESGPCRTVLITAKLLGIDLELIYVDLFKGEHLTPEFFKMNPAHRVPTFRDGDFVLSESRCIITYLAEEYGKDDSLYPKDAKKRALINQRLFFDIATLYTPIVKHYNVVYSGSKSFDESQMPSIQEGFKLLNIYLEESKFVVGDTLTIADIALISTVDTAVAVFDFDLKPYPNVQRWFDTTRQCLPDFEGIVTENSKKLRFLVDTHKTRNNQA